MSSDKQAEANRQNALQSTGPRTSEGIEAVRFNALRHGLRSLQTVIPGEDPEAWEAHRAGIVEDLQPLGAVELALAEQIAAKLWRLGRVVRHEAAVTAIGQDPEVLAHDHEKSDSRLSESHPGPDEIVALQDVRAARRSLERAEEKLAARLIGIRLLEALPGMADDHPIPPADWSAWEAMKEDLELGDRADKVFKGEEDFVALHLRQALKMKGEPEEMRTGLLGYWRETEVPKLGAKVELEAANSEAVRRRYEAALERLRLSRGLPDEAALEKIQRYEAHLERGLHKALERLRALQEARGAVASSHKPAVALAVIQAAPEPAGMGSFGSLAIQADGPGTAASN
jgi:hypothetical protein